MVGAQVGRRHTEVHPRLTDAYLSGGVRSRTGKESPGTDPQSISLDLGKETGTYEDQGTTGGTTRDTRPTPTAGEHFPFCRLSGRSGRGGTCRPPVLDRTTLTWNSTPPSGRLGSGVVEGTACGRQWSFVVDTAPCRPSRPSSVPPVENSGG